VERLLEILRGRRPEDHPYLVGITGGVAVGKSTLAEQLAGEPARLAGPGSSAAVLPSDCFLHPNAELERRGLTMEKGFPDTYDVDALRHALGELTLGRPITAPSYSHRTYDIDPQARVEVDAAAVVLVEGLHLTRFAGDLLDVTVHLDAPAEVAEEWYVERFLALVSAAGEDPGSFYRLFLGPDPDELAAIARHLWTTINLVNLREHIAPWRDRADVVVALGPSHEVLSVTTS
jgi:type I pantothenate kinase